MQEDEAVGWGCGIIRRLLLLACALCALQRGIHACVTAEAAGEGATAAALAGAFRPMLRRTKEKRRMGRSPVARGERRPAATAAASARGSRCGGARGARVCVQGEPQGAAPRHLAAGCCCVMLSPGHQHSRGLAACACSLWPGCVAGVYHI